MNICLSKNSEILSNFLKAPAAWCNRKFHKISTEIDNIQGGTFQKIINIFKGLILKMILLPVFVLSAIPYGVNSIIELLKPIQHVFNTVYLQSFDVDEKYEKYFISNTCNTIATKFCNDLKNKQISIRAVDVSLLHNKSEYNLFLDFSPCWFMANKKIHENDMKNAIRYLLGLNVQNKNEALDTLSSCFKMQLIKKKNTSGITIKYQTKY